MQTSIRALTALALAVAGLSAHTGAAAATVVSYGFDGHPSSLGANSVDSLASASNASLTGVAQWLGSSGALYMMSFSGSLGYVEFSVEADSGYELDLSTLEVSLRAESGSTPVTIRSSVDGFASALYSGTPSGAGYPGFESYSVNLSGASFQDVTGNLAFRLYVSKVGGAAAISVDSITLNGNVAALAAPVPEAGTGALLLAGLGMVGALGRRRVVPGSAAPGN